MRLVTFLDTDSSAQLGLKLGGASGTEVLRVEDAMRAAGIPLRGGVSCMDVVTQQSQWISVLERLTRLHSEKKLPPACTSQIKDLKLLAPLPRPLSLRDGYAFRQHVETARRNRGLEMAPEFEQFPVFYFSNALSVTGPGEVQVHAAALERLDYELEVAVVIGKTGRNIPASQADSHIFGYMIMNDWSARRLQMDEMKLNLGPAKGKDFATSLGPELVTRDELAAFATQSSMGERHALGMRARVNGKTLSEGNLRDIHWTFAQIIERISQGVTLHAGEVIGSGTVGTGCLLELNGSGVTKDLWLRVGDEITLEIDELGALSNRVAAER